MACSSTAASSALPCGAIFPPSSSAQARIYRRVGKHGRGSARTRRTANECWRDSRWRSWKRLARRSWRSGSSVLSREVVPEQTDRVLRLVAVDAKILPVAAVGRVVVVVPVLVMHGQQVEV